MATYKAKVSKPGCKPPTEETEGLKTVQAAVEWIESHIGKLGPRTRRTLASKRYVKRKDGSEGWIFGEDEVLDTDGRGGIRAYKREQSVASTPKKRRAVKRRTRKERGQPGKVLEQEKFRKQRGVEGKQKTLFKDGEGLGLPIPSLGALAEDARAKEKAERADKGTAAHGVVRARAGTGKTFTLVVGVGRRTLTAKQMTEGLGFEPVPSEQQQAIWDFIDREPAATVQYIAFNKSIVKDFSRKYKWMSDALHRRNVTLSFSTVHSMGFRVTCRAYGLSRRDVNKYKTRNQLERRLGVDFRVADVWRQLGGMATAVEKLVSKCKITLTGWTPDGGFNADSITDEELDRLAARFDIEAEDREEAYGHVRGLLAEATPVKGGCQEIDFDDQIWLPVIHNLQVPRFDLLMVDEGQDLNRCQQEFALRCGKRIILVGDEAQAIYGFAGADGRSIPRMMELLGATRRGVEEMRLTMTRRCGKAIVEQARQLVPDFEAHPDNVPGEVGSMEAERAMDAMTDADMVLCRTNAPIIGTAFRLLRAKRRANIQGRDIGRGIKDLIKKSKADDVSDLLVWLDDYKQREMERLEKKRNVDDAVKIALEDRVECVRALCDGAVTIREVTTAIDNLFKGLQCPKCKRFFDEEAAECYRCKTVLERPEGVLLSSIHRAKGMEAGRVWLLCPEQLPHPMAKTPEAREQETNLEYVAVTRAINTFTTISGETHGQD